MDLPSPPPDTTIPIPPDLARCIRMSNIILLQCVSTATGPSIIVQGLDAGILSAFLTSWPWLRRVVLDSSLDLTVSNSFFANLKQFLVYRSVLRSLQKSLKTVQRMTLDVEDFQCAAWLSFQTTIMLQISTKDLFDRQSESRLDAGFCGCANPGVSK